MEGAKWVDELPEKLKSKRGGMDEPSNRRDLDLVCHCGEKLWYLGETYHRISYAAVICYDEDGEPVYGDRHANAPYAHWMCINNHEETNGYLTMDRFILLVVEKELAFRLCNDRISKTDEEWADIAKSADKLIGSTVPISRYSDVNLHDCIAYASFELSITTGEKNRLDNREHRATMYHAFWFYVAELARRRMAGR